MHSRQAVNLFSPAARTFSSPWSQYPPKAGSRTLKPEKGTSAPQEEQDVKVQLETPSTVPCNSPPLPPRQHQQQALKQQSPASQPGETPWMVAGAGFFTPLWRAGQQSPPNSSSNGQADHQPAGEPEGTGQTL
ncbi:hypothetical protein UY3_16687 [Chelonia mydas]|uniref:Uncharacterized protein n=1 Tax=Chelonia mydas TaxID=8469 RepID=M7ANY9_CHEMY|nr:hypothetical protein UY3_16687 [Chelonia mydas]